MIVIKGFHGQLNPMDSLRMNNIATVYTKDYIWHFNGTIQDFADTWKKNFLVWYQDGIPQIYVTSKRGFATIG